MRGALASRSKFSPRMRGCSRQKRHQKLRLCVFPAYAGMFPGRGDNRGRRRCFPRVCGDVPNPPLGGLGCDAFSPRMRGCSVERLPGSYQKCVFPAYAGMFLLSSRVSSWVKSFPRVCGDVPPLRPCKPRSLAFSPRMRGCSSTWFRNRTGSTVFPAYAGMFPVNVPPMG